MHARLALALAAFPLAAHAADSYIFTFAPVQSSLQLSPDFSVATDGTLIGSYDAASNPTGTQTRPGIFGGSGNNLIPAAIDLSLSGSDTTHPLGRFRLDADLDAGLFTLAGFEADMLGGASLDLPLTLGLLYQTFHTVAPSAIFPGGTRLPIPLGNATISTLSMVQTAPTAGPLVPTETPGVFTFVTVIPIDAALSASALAQTFDLPPTPGLLPLTGTLDARTPQPVITVTWTTAFDQEVPPEVIAQIPPIENQPLDLPTILPPGNTAHLLMSLTVGSIHTGLDSTAAIVALGTPHCDADLNNDGMVDWFDYKEFVAAFEAGTPAADFNQDRFIDFFDYSDFVDAYSNPCNT